MKYIFYIAFVVLFFGCNSENANDCFQAEGTIIQEEFIVEHFDKILVMERVRLIIKQGDEQKVVLETGDNLLNDVEVSVTNGELKIINNNACNLVRDYLITKVFVTSPNIIQIRNSTGYQVESIGTLSYPELTLLSENFENEDLYRTDGDFQLSLSVNSLHVLANGLSNFFLSGSANNVTINFYAGDSRLEAENLIIQNLNIDHRGTNKMLVNPQQSIQGVIRSGGDVISYNRPLIVDVEELYTGRLIFQD